VFHHLKPTPFPLHPKLQSTPSLEIISPVTMCQHLYKETVKLCAICVRALGSSLFHTYASVHTCGCIYLGSCVSVYVRVIVCRHVCGAMTFPCLSVEFHSFGLTLYTCTSYLQPHHLLIPLARFSRLLSLRREKKKKKSKSGSKKTRRFALEESCFCESSKSN